MRIPANLRESLLKQAIKAGLMMLTLDTETSHIIARLWHIGSKVFVTHNSVKVPNKVITIQYKWAHEKKAKYLMWDRVSDKYDDSRNFDDSNMIQEFVTNVLSKADIIVTQNGDKFDLVILNERAKALKLSVLDQKPSIDILKLSRKSFKAISHKLDYRSSQQGLGGKITMIDEDWVNIEERGVSPEKKMIPYGLKDVVDTEKLLWRELPYYKDLPVVVEKTILSFLNTVEQKKSSAIFCSKCRSKHRPSRLIEKQKGKDICSNCNSNQWLESK